MMNRVSAQKRRGEIALVLASIALVLTLAEVGARLLGAGTPRPSGYAPVNTRRRGMSPTNAKGYRDNEHPLAKPAGVRRLLSLGDSFAWGAGIEFEDTYPQRLERSLSRRRREPWRVVNLALPGMNTVDEASQLVQEGFAYGPDIVLVGYVLNDSEDSEAAEARRARDWAEERQQKREPRLFDRSALYRLVAGRLWATAENRRRIAGYKSMYAADAPGWVAAQKALKLMGGLCRERGVPFVVTIFPLFGQPLDDRYPFADIHARVREASSAAGAKVIDLLPSYRGLRWDLLVVDGVEDEHPNEIAHRIAADVISKALDDVVPPSAP
jgi:GDSL-like Lipase/Acylhydrolase family